MNRPVHFEILVDDLERASNFYTKVFGWDMSTWDGSVPYILIKTGERNAPGIDGAIMGRHFQQGIINTIEVQSLDDTVAKIEAEGGKKVHGPNAIPNVGIHAYCTDTEGNLFGVLQPNIL